MYKLHFFLVKFLFLFFATRAVSHHAEVHRAGKCFQTVRKVLHSACLSVPILCELTSGANLFPFYLGEWSL
jgi:hypothetical protein